MDKENSEKIVVKNLYKIFGPTPEKALKLINQGYSNWKYCWGYECKFQGL
jgi:ABC-type proline/glycine betaine transport system ATPase subunit